MLTDRFSATVSLAAQAHADQTRKGTGTPYIAHPLGVASLVIEFGGDEEQAIAALLHDVLEDGGPQFSAPIEQQFGSRVLGLVRACTDGMPDTSGKKAPWKKRKLAYLQHLLDTPSAALVISACDKLHNARAILDDIRDPGVGLAVFERFSASKEETLWYYGELARIFYERQSPVARKLSDTVTEIRRMAA